MNRRTLMISCYTGFFLIGIINVLLPPVLPFIIQDYEVSFATAGTLFSTRAAGVFAGVLLGGLLFDHLGKKLVIVTACLLQGIGLVLFSLTTNWYLGLVLFALAGLGTGFLDPALNAIVAQLNSGRRGAALNTLHAVYGIGALVGPLITGYLLSVQVSWRIVCTGVAAIWGLYLLAVAPISYPSGNEGEQASSKGQEGEAKSRMTLRALFIHPIILMLFFVSFIYNGAANGLVGWINTYADQLEFPLLLGASLVSIFYAGLTIGRFTCGTFADRLGYSRTILLCASGCLIFYPLAAFVTNAVAMSIGVFFAGFFFSGLHPTGLAYVNSLFPSIAGTVSGLLSTALSLGVMVVPWVVGLLADRAGFKPGLGIGYGLVVVLVLISLRLMRMEKEPAQREVGV